MDDSSLYFLFLKVLHVHVTTQKKHHCDTQRSRPVLLLDLCCPWNKGRLQKRNTLSKPPSYRPFTNFHAYFMFLHTLDACLALWDPHTDVNWHLRNTWLLWFFTKLENWSSYSERLPIFSLHHPWSSLFRLGYDMYQVSCWRHLNICHGLGCTW